MEKEDNRRVWLGITYTVPAKPSRALGLFNQWPERFG